MPPFAAILDRPVVAITGPDARRFCNAMFTNNARDLVPGAAQRTAMLDDRGRVHGLLDLYCEADDRFLAVLDGSTEEAFTTRYALYVVLDDVELAPRADLACATVQGAAPAVPHDLRSLPRDRTGQGGVDVVGPAHRVTAWLAELALPGVDEPTIERLRVRVGDPRWPVDFGDKRLPHEMGLRDAFLSFDKGCYLGQETVNRVDVMGDVKQRLAGVRLAGEVPAGAELVVGEAVVGRLTSVVDDPGLGRIGLAVLRRPADAPGTELVARWDTGSAPAVTSALPFPDPG